MLERRSRVAVIGAGVGGLAAAIDLASSGHAVTLLERAPVTGGKMRTLDVGGLAVDAGPTVLTMRWVLDDLFARASGRRLEDYARLEPAGVLARHAWSDGLRLDLFADREQTVDAIGALFGREDAQAYRDFCSYARRIYETVESPFLRSQRPGVGGLLKAVGKVGLGALAHIDAHRTMWRSLEAAFRAPQLRQLFGRYATYCGASPFEAPATLNVIAHVESLGVFRVVGGMRALAAALARLAREVGVTIRHDAEVAEVMVRHGRAIGVALVDGEAITADAVVASTDASALGSGLLGDGARRAAKVTLPGSRSFSAVTWALAGRAVGFPLVHHNVFFSDDYETECASLTGARRVPEAPTVYVCAQDRGDRPIDAEEERMLVIINAPATGDTPSHWSSEERHRCKASASSTMRRCGLELEPRAILQTTPVEFHRMFPGTGGALYGPRANGPLSSLSRLGARTRVSGLYLAGGSVHPGAGVPMAILSGHLAAESLREDLRSTERSPPAATSGSTSMA